MKRNERPNRPSRVFRTGSGARIRTHTHTPTHSPPKKKVRCNSFFCKNLIWIFEAVTEVISDTTSIKHLYALNNLKDLYLFESVPALELACEARGINYN